MTVLVDKALIKLPHSQILFSHHENTFLHLKHFIY